jgi:hypothetical protein
MVIDKLAPAYTVYYPIMNPIARENVASSLREISFHEFHRAERGDHLDGVVAVAFQGIFNRLGGR